MKIELKVNKTRNVEFRIEDNPSELGFTESRVRDTFTLKITPDATQIGNHTIIVSATHDGETIKKSINLTVNGTASVTYTDAPDADFDNAVFQQELEQVDEEDDDKDIFAFQTTNDYNDNVEIEVTDPDKEKSNDFNIVKLKKGSATATANSKRRKIRGRAFKFGLYKFKVKIRNGAIKIVKLKTIFISQKRYTKQLDFGSLFNGLRENIDYVIRYTNGKDKLDITVNSGVVPIALASANDAAKKRELTLNIIDDIKDSSIYKSLISNFRVRYVSPEVIEFYGNRLVNNLEIKTPDFIIDTDNIKAIQNVDTIISKLELPNFFNSAHLMVY